MKTTYILTATAILALASCSKEEVASKETETSSDLTSLIISERPENSTSIKTLRETAKPGDEVTFTGAAIGSSSIFLPNRAVMILGDPKILTSCDRMPGDNCSTPWDVCCDDPETIKSSIVTVQVLDENGSPLKTGLKNLSGIKELSTLTVTGTVAPSSNEDNMVINATALHVEP